MLHSSSPLYNQSQCYPEALQIHKMTGMLLGQENSAQNTVTAKTHFYMFKNITEGSQIIFIRIKQLSRILIETKGCLGVLQIPLVSINIACPSQTSENALSNIKNYIAVNQKTNLFFPQTLKSQSEVSVGYHCVSKSHFTKPKRGAELERKTDENLISESE